MDKKFVNLPKNYHKFLNSYNKLLTKKIVDKVLNKKMSYDEILKFHNEINKIKKDSDCCNFDINKMIHAYNKKNYKIGFLTKISSLHSKHIILKAYKSKLWKTYINQLKKKFKKIDNLETTYENVEKQFLNLLKKYKYDWNGLSHIINIDSKGNIKNINLFDINDIEELKSNLHLSNSG